MRWIVPLAMLLAGIGWLLVETDWSPPGLRSDASQASESVDAWRRTSRGWEKTSAWEPIEFTDGPPFHPGLLAAFQAWTAIAAFVCTRPRMRPRLEPTA